MCALAVRGWCRQGRAGHSVIHHGWLRTRACACLVGQPKNVLKHGARASPEVSWRVSEEAPSIVKTHGLLGPAAASWSRAISEKDVLAVYSVMRRPPNGTGACVVGFGASGQRANQLTCRFRRVSQLGHVRKLHVSRISASPMRARPIPC